MWAVVCRLRLLWYFVIGFVETGSIVTSITINDDIMSEGLNIIVVVRNYL